MAMGSVSSLNPGAADLLQTLSNVNSPVLSSPAAVSALEKAPTTDIVQLSQSASQLENVDTLFGIPNSATESSTPGIGNLLAELESPQTAVSPSVSSILAAATAPGTSSTTSSTTVSSASTEASQLASYQAASQFAETEALFGTAPTATLPDTSLLNLLG
jgi:hypothetical protein